MPYKTKKFQYYEDEHPPFYFHYHIEGLKRKDFEMIFSRLVKKGFKVERISKTLFRVVDEKERQIFAIQLYRSRQFPFSTCNHFFIHDEEATKQIFKNIGIELIKVKMEE